MPMKKYLLQNLSGKWYLNFMEVLLLLSSRFYFIFFSDRKSDYTVVFSMHHFIYFFTGFMFFSGPASCHLQCPIRKHNFQAEVYGTLSVIDLSTSFRFLFIADDINFTKSKRRWKYALFTIKTEIMKKMPIEQC